MTRFALERDGNWTKATMDLSISSNDGETLLHGLAGVTGLLGNEDSVKEWLRFKYGCHMTMPKPEGFVQSQCEESRAVLGDALFQADKAVF